MDGISLDNTVIMVLRQKAYEGSVQVSTDIDFIDGDLFIPETAESLVIFAHGSGSGRLSKRNQFVANELNKVNIATLLIDLLTEEEDIDDQSGKKYRFDIPLLAGRLLSASKWAQRNDRTKHLRLGYFGASTGAAAALMAAVKSDKIAAVVSRGGRPDLADKYLVKVSAPVLLIVGGDDHGVIELNQNAYKQLNCTKELKIVPGATHLFEEPGKLEEVTLLAKDWFKQYLN